MIKYFLVGTLLMAACKRPSTDHLTIAVAANMQFAMEELVQDFERQSGIKCEIVVSSSGKLTAQIIEGAPFDLLVSADLKYPQELFRAGVTADSPVAYAYGKLVLWSMMDNYTPSTPDLSSAAIRHVAVANPQTAPYGQAALEVLQHHGILEMVRDKLVYGESISQVNQFIVSGAAEVGFTAKAVVLSKQIKGTGQWIEIDQDQYSAIAQGLVIIENENTEWSRQFVDFLLSPEGQEILRGYGYETKE